MPTLDHTPALGLLAGTSHLCQDQPSTLTTQPFPLRTSCEIDPINSFNPGPEYQFLGNPFGGELSQHSYAAAFPMTVSPWQLLPSSELQQSVPSRNIDGLVLDEPIDHWRQKPPIPQLQAAIQNPPNPVPVNHDAYMTHGSDGTKLSRGLNCGKFCAADFM